nr:hypothetical protein BaRGS_030392 [Batillaria attramentaria]
MLNYVLKLKANPDNPAYNCVFKPDFEDLHDVHKNEPKPLSLRVRPLLQAAGVDINSVDESVFPATPPWTLPIPEVRLDLTSHKKAETPDPVYFHGLQQILADFPGFRRIFTDGSKSEDGRVGAAAVMDARTKDVHNHQSKLALQTKIVLLMAKLVLFRHGVQRIPWFDGLHDLGFLLPFFVLKAVLDLGARHYGVPGKIISLIQCTYQDMSCRIAHAGQLSESFEVKTGVRQGCLLSPFLFLLVIDWIMKTTTAGRKNGIQWTLWTQLDDLDFADDLALLSHSHSQMQDKTTCLEATSAGTRLKINRKETELMKINTTANTPVTVGGEPIREVESFVYLGSVVDGQGGTDRDVTARIGKARAAMVMLKNVWASKVVSIRTKLRIFNSNVKSVLLYGCETWRTTKAMQQKIQTFLNTCLRRIFNIRWPEKIRNEELWERAGQEPVAKQILRRKWGWIGHTLRKPASSTTRQALTWNPQGKRKRGRPRNSWRRDTEAELCKQGTNWTGVARLAQNRVRWRRVVDGLCSTWSQGPK